MAPKVKFTKNIKKLMQFTNFLKLWTKLSKLLKWMQRKKSRWTKILKIFSSENKSFSFFHSIPSIMLLPCKIMIMQRPPLKSLLATQYFCSRCGLSCFWFRKQNYLPRSDCTTFTCTESVALIIRSTAASCKCKCERFSTNWMFRRGFLAFSKSFCLANARRTS